MEYCKLTSGFDISHHLLKVELSKVLEKEKSDMKTIENDRKRFWIKHKRLKNLKEKTCSKEVDEYLRSLKVKNDLSANEKRLYEVIRCMVFTNGEIDLDKILCLHLLSAHAVEPLDNEYALPSTSTLSAQTNSTEDKNEQDMEDPWDSVLPYYVVQIKQDEEQQIQEKEVREIDFSGNEDFLHILTPKMLDDISLRSASIYGNFLKAAKERGEILENQRIETLQEKAYATGIKNKFKNLAKTSFSPKMSMSLSMNFSSCNASVNLPMPNLPMKMIKKAPTNYTYLRPVQAINDTHRKKVKVVMVCINKELSALVQSIMEVLENVSPDKMRNIIKILKEPKELVALMAKSEICKFYQNLNEFGLLTSPKNFAIKCLFALEEPDLNSKYKLKKHIVAETLEVDQNLLLEEIITTVRRNVSKYIEMQESIESKHDSSTEEQATSPKLEKEITGNLSEKDIGSLPSSKGFKINFDDSMIPDKIKSNEKRKTNISSKSSKKKKPKSLNVWQENNLISADLIVLRRMTNEQRILVGQKCASLKTKKINNEGVWTEKVSLPDLMSSVLPQESIKYLTRGTVYALNGNRGNDQLQGVKENRKSAPEKLTELMLAELRCEIAEIETQKKLTNFMDKSL